MAVLDSVNVGCAAPNPYKPNRRTGIAKQPQAGAVMVRDPGARGSGLGSGLVGDFIGDVNNHGGSEQAVYAFSREDLDVWQQRLGRSLPNGYFGENFTTRDIDVNGALIGERWRVGDAVEVAITCPRIPCATFRGWVNEPGWLKIFTQAARPGAYLRVVVPGLVRAGDVIEVVRRPEHDVSVSLVYRAVTVEPELLPAVLAAGPDLPADIAEQARRWLAAGRHPA